MHQVSQKHFNTKQGRFESLTEYYKRFKTTVEILEHYSANIWYHPSLILKEYKEDGHMNMTINNNSNDKILYEKYGKVVKNRAIEFAFLKGVQKDRYGNLIYNLKSQYSRQVNHYPMDLNQAFRFLSTHKRKLKNENSNENKSKKIMKRRSRKRKKWHLYKHRTKKHRNVFFAVETTT